MKFYDGQTVVCVNDRFRSLWWRAMRAQVGITVPVRGRRYVVRGYSDGPAPDCVLLREIANPLVRWTDGRMREVAFWDERFRPVTDIGDLEKCLTRRSIPRSLRRDERDYRPAPKRRQKENA